MVESHQAHLVDGKGLDAVTLCVLLHSAVLAARVWADPPQVQIPQTLLLAFGIFVDVVFGDLGKRLHAELRGGGRAG